MPSRRAEEMLVSSTSGLPPDTAVQQVPKNALLEATINGVPYVCVRLEQDPGRMLLALPYVPYARAGASLWMKGHAITSSGGHWPLYSRFTGPTTVNASVTVQLVRGHASGIRGGAAGIAKRISVLIGGGGKGKQGPGASAEDEDGAA
jgi:hypothetical protein